VPGSGCYQTNDYYEQHNSSNVESADGSGAAILTARAQPRVSLMAAFVGGRSGEWRVERFEAVTGIPLEPVTHIRIVEGTAVNGIVSEASWVLRGVVSNERYVTRVEHEALASLQAPVGRTASTCAALIPITKAERWWKLAQDERRRIFEESSRHVAIGLQYLPAIARRLHHARDLGEPFDFLTWFEYAQADAPAFEELVGKLRNTEEWTYVEREIDIRLIR